MTNSLGSNFSTELRQLTQDDHTEAETSEFITTLMGGARSASDYTLLIAQYAHLYEALEHEVRVAAADPSFTELFDPALERSAQIAKDLQVLLPAHGFAALPEALPATRVYIDAIHQAATEPARLVAHHYLRYLGDLSGGLAIGKLVARHYGISSEALNMWDFGEIEKPKLYKDAYRAKLDALGADPRIGAAILDEAKRGFHWNKAIFEDLLRSSNGELIST